MRIRGTVMTPVLAIFTVLALIATGVVLGQARNGDASATLLDSVSDLAMGAGTNAALAGVGRAGGAYPTLMAGAERTASLSGEDSEDDFADDEYEVESSYSEHPEDAEHESEQANPSSSEYESDSHYEEED